MLGLAACSMPAWRSASAQAPRPWATDEIAPGIHIRHGLDEDVSATNDDAIANIGFIVGREAVAVLDAGGSLNDGRRLRASIRQATQLPIRYVLMSHVHPDHVFGAGAFSADHPVYVGHAGLPRALSLRWEYYRARTEAILGKDTVGAAVMPTMLVHDHAQIDLGGRVLELTAHGIAHTDSDLSAFDRQTGTLIAADLLFVRRVPSLDGSLKGWLQELALLKSSRRQARSPRTWPDERRLAGWLPRSRALSWGSVARDPRGHRARARHRCGGEDGRAVGAQALGAVRRLQWPQRHPGI
jgi:quinoprotein relay system zinc metallohydrolase 2